MAGGQEWMGKGGHGPIPMWEEQGNQQGWAEDTGAAVDKSHLGEDQTGPFFE